MELFSDLKELFKSHIYSIITAVIIALLTFGYLSYIIPNNETKEDVKNIAILKGIEKHLITYIDDQVKYISEDKMITLNLSPYKGSKDIYIDAITIDKNGFKQLENGTIKLSRTIKLSNRFKNSNYKPEKKDTIKDVITIDLVKFLNKINSTTPFSSFYICPVEEGKCQSDKSFLSTNVSLEDQDSLIINNRKNGPFSFKNSSKHYYANQVYIPQTKHTLFLAAGIEKSYFQTSARQIDSTLLIFSLFLIIVLILGINFIKPIISSYKERLSQIDLVSVVFSIGLLIAVLVVFGTLLYWNDAVKTRTTKDLDQLVNKIDASFSQQIMAYKNWKNKDSLFEKTWENPEYKFAKIYLKTDSVITSLNGDPFPQKNDTLREDQKCYITGGTDLKKGTKKSKLIKYLDDYFRMDSKGLITKDLSNTNPDIPRKYADRMYFKILQPKNTDNLNIDNNIETVLTAVFSREEDKYQWIYVEKDSYDKKNQKSENSIKGIAFRESFSKEIKLPPGTSYMLIDRNGDVLMQNDPEKNLYQNLLNGSRNNPELISLLSGIIPKSLEMEYQGKHYQISAKKLTAKSDSPIYILGIRDLSHLNRLSIFTFSNGFLISVLYGFFLLLITYLYSTLFYGNRMRMFSNHLFYHLFPDNSRAYEYKLLLIVNSISIVLATIVSFISSPSIGLIFSIILGVNIAFINLITLNIYTLNSKKELIKLVLILFCFAICLPLILFYYNNLWFAIFVLFSTHIALILYYRNWRNREKTDLKTFVKQNTGVNRKIYIKFLTARLLHQFVVFPFILISAFYVTELNDFARYYCSSHQVKEKDKERINAYSCNCDLIKQPLISPKSNNDILQKANLGFFDRPATYEIKNFTINKLSNKYYLNSQAILQKQNWYSFFLIALLSFIGLAFLVYKLLCYYSNHFFFYDLMQAAHEKYYPCTKNQLANDHIFIAMVDNDDIKNLIQIPNTTGCSDREIDLDKVFDDDENNEISPFLRMDFILSLNVKHLNAQYDAIWDLLPDDETRFVLFDFAQDHFVNYKNKDTIINLMESGIIDSHKLTGRLKLMSLSFRIFILSKSKGDEFIQKFTTESKNGTFSKLKFPILIVAVSGLVLLMYLNKNSYDQLALMGGSITAVIALINKFLDANKSL